MKPLLLIQSPDPELQEMLTLRFELEGIHVTTNAHEKNCAACVVDLISQEKKEAQAAQTLLQKLKKKNGTKSVLLLPRGTRSTSPSWKADLIVQKPFELEWLAKTVTRLISKQP